MPRHQSIPPFYFHYPAQLSDPSQGVGGGQTPSQLRGFSHSGLWVYPRTGFADLGARAKSPLLPTLICKDDGLVMSDATIIPLGEKPTVREDYGFRKDDGTVVRVDDSTFIVSIRCRAGDR